MKTNTELFQNLSTVLLQTGAKLQVGADLAPGTLGSFNKQTATISLASDDLETLAHESVHWLQKINRNNKIKELEGLDPLQFNPDLTHSEALKIINFVRVNYSHDCWKREIPAYALEQNPEKVYLLLLMQAERMRRGEIKKPTPNIIPTALLVMANVAGLLSAITTLTWLVIPAILLLFLLVGILLAE